MVRKTLSIKSYAQFVVNSVNKVYRKTGIYLRRSIGLDNGYLNVIKFLYKILAEKRERR